jgi:hypothetical protein
MAVILQACLAVCSGISTQATTSVCFSWEGFFLQHSRKCSVVSETQHCITAFCGAVLFTLTLISVSNAALLTLLSQSLNVKI